MHAGLGEAASKVQVLLTRLGVERREMNVNFLFRDIDAAKRFWRDLKRACQQYKDRDAAQVDLNINN